MFELNAGIMWCMAHENDSDMEDSEPEEAADSDDDAGSDGDSDSDGSSGNKSEVDEDDKTGFKSDWRKLLAEHEDISLATTKDSLTADLFSSVKSTKGSVDFSRDKSILYNSCCYQTTLKGPLSELCIVLSVS